VDEVEELNALDIEFAKPLETLGFAEGVIPNELAAPE
jgi:hypothetical protein